MTPILPDYKSLRPSGQQRTGQHMDRCSGSVRYHPVKTGHRRLAEAPTAAGVEGVVNWRLRVFLNLKSADIFS